jgi:hypothetical protein
MTALPTSARRKTVALWLGVGGRAVGVGKYTVVTIAAPVDGLAFTDVADSCEEFGEDGTDASLVGSLGKGRRAVCRAISLKARSFTLLSSSFLHRNGLKLFAARLLRRSTLPDFPSGCSDVPRSPSSFLAFRVSCRINKLRALNLKPNPTHKGSTIAICVQHS